MKSEVSLLCVVVSLVLLLLMVADASCGQPKALMPETTWDFGKVPQGSVVSHSYQIKNIGTDTLKIIKVKPEWGCTTAPVQKMELAVGDSTDIEMIFNSRGYRGKVQKSANVMLNDTTAGVVRISLSAEVVENPDSIFPLVISTPEIDFSPIKGKMVVEKEVKIKNVSQEEIKLKVVDSSVGFFEIRFSDERIKPSEEIDLKLRLNRDLKEDSFKKSITLELNDKAKTRFSIPVKREVKMQ